MSCSTSSVLEDSPAIENGKSMVVNPTASILKNKIKERKRQKRIEKRKQKKIETLKAKHQKLIEKKKRKKCKTFKERVIAAKSKLYPNFSLHRNFTVPNGINIVILKGNFPTGKINTEEKHIIKMKLLQEIDKISETQIVPKILFTGINQGIFLIVLEDAQSAKWVEDTFNNNQNVLDGCVLKVMPVDEIPKFGRVIFITKDVFTGETSEFLERLDKLNPELKVLDWHFEKRNNHPFIETWSFLVKAEYFKTMWLHGRIAYTGLGLGTFKIKHNLDAQ